MRPLLIVAITLLTFSAQAQNKTADTLWVDGICGMCKDRIENALDVKGVWVAEWNIDTRQLYVVYKDSKISKEEISTILNTAGHDTEISKASDAHYNTLHACCRYRNEAVKNEYNKEGDNED